MQKRQKVTDKTHLAEPEDSQETEESSVIEEVDEFLDEIDKLLEGQEVLATYRQRGGQ